MLPSWLGVVVGMTTPHEITISRCDQHVEVMIGAELLAKTDRAVLLRETGLPVRYYVPREDVRMGLLQATETTTTCPYKGAASYWSADLDGAAHLEVAWSYEDPIPAVEEIAGLLSFYPDRVELTASPPA